MSQDFNTILYSALCACFGLDSSSPEASVLIREAYQESENAPRPPRNSDVIYYSVAPDPVAAEAPPAHVPEEASQASHAATVSSFSAWTMTVVCYGPHALSNARKIRAFLLWMVLDFPGKLYGRPGSGRCRNRRSRCCCMSRKDPSGEKERI